MSTPARERANQTWKITDSNQQDNSPNVSVELISDYLAKQRINYQDINGEVAATIEDGGDDFTMKENEYVNQKDLDILKDNLEQKIEMNQKLISSSIDSLKNETNLKIDSINKEIDYRLDNQYLKIEALLNQKFSEQKDKQTASTRWIIGTIIAAAGLTITIIKLFI